MDSAFLKRHFRQRTFGVAMMAFRIKLSTKKKAPWDLRTNGLKALR